MRRLGDILRTIRGTRVRVTIVIGSLAGGMTFEQIQREYDLTADDIRAGLLFVAELAEHAYWGLRNL
jgi:uncharacterized protein (DUF433 family)